MEWMILPLKRYADFAARSRRMEYWMFTLFFVIGYFGLAIIGGMLFDGGIAASAATQAVDVLSASASLAAPSFWPSAIFALALFVPALAVQVRRFHDSDKSGWFVLLHFIPFFGTAIVLVFMLLEGTRGPNRFGPDPKGHGLSVNDGHQQI